VNNSRFLAAAVFTLASAIGTASADDAENAYHEGRYTDALALLEERGLEGDAESQSMVGMMYLMGSRLYGDQVTTDPERAARWLRAAALNGNVQAQYVLAQLYQTGHGVPLKPERAAALLAQLEISSVDSTISRGSVPQQ
jgi:uncharacterized protein